MNSANVQPVHGIDASVITFFLHGLTTFLPLAPETGFEPVTSWLTASYSPAELLGNFYNPLDILRHIAFFVNYTSPKNLLPYRL